MSVDCITARTKQKGDILHVETRDFPQRAFEILQKWLGPESGPDAVLLHPGHGKRALLLLRFESFARTHTIVRGD